MRKCASFGTNENKWKASDPAGNVIMQHGDEIGLRRRPYSVNLLLSVKLTVARYAHMTHEGEIVVEDKHSENAKSLHHEKLTATLTGQTEATCLTTSQNKK